MTRSSRRKGTSTKGQNKEQHETEERKGHGNGREVGQEEESLDDEEMNWQLPEKRGPGRPRALKPVTLFRCPFGDISRNQPCSKFRGGTRKARVCLYKSVLLTKVLA